MCYTEEGLELTRLSAVDQDGAPLMDMLVKPTNPIVNVRSPLPRSSVMLNWWY